MGRAPSLLNESFFDITKSPTIYTKKCVTAKLARSAGTDQMAVNAQ